MADEIDLLGFSEYWDSGKYAMLGTYDQGFSIIDRATGATEIIEVDEVVYELILQRMQEKGVPMYEELPEAAKRYQQRCLELFDSGLSASEVNRQVKELPRDY